MFNVLKRLLFIALLALPLSSSAASKHLTILHFNDLHGHLSSEDGSGGAARITTIVRGIEKANAEEGSCTLVFFGGDAVSGTLVSSEFEGGAEFDFFNLLGVSAIAIGNHDFDFGLQRLEDLIAKAKFPFVAANIYWKESGDRFAPAYAVVGCDDLKVAVLGLAHPDTPTLTNPANVARLSFTDPVAEAKKGMKKLKRASPFRMALTHEGVDADVKLAGKISGFFAIVGGHDHVKPKDYCRIVKEIPVCQTPPNGGYVGRLDFDLDGKKLRLVESKLIPVRDGVDKDPATERLIDSYEKQVSGKYDRVIGRAVCDLAPQRGKAAALGRIVAEAIREMTGADAAFINSAGLRTAIKKGKITSRDVAAVLPFKNRLVLLSMTGKQVEEILHFSMERGGGAFLQVSGIEYGVAAKEPTSVTIDRKPLDAEKVYKIGTVDFLANGGEGYGMLKDAKDRKDLDAIVSEAMIDYIKKKKVIGRE